MHQARNQKLNTGEHFLTGGGAKFFRLLLKLLKIFLQLVVA